MDLTQRKLNRDEWNSIEIKVDNNEVDILKMISDGYYNENIQYNYNTSIINFLKIPYNEGIEYLIFEKYFKNDIEKEIKKYELNFNIENNFKKVHAKKADTMRLNIKDKIDNSYIFEFQILELVSLILKKYKKKSNKWSYYLYSYLKVKDNKITNINKYVLSYINFIINKFYSLSNKKYILQNSQEYIEKNEFINYYADKKLYEHQKQIYSICKNDKNSKMILYSAPTATGKTLTPIGLSNEYRIIFLCAARHVGISLSRSAISSGKKVAFAFGCSSSDDIRLHYNAASEYVRRDGTYEHIKYKDGKKKVDNSVGDKVEIMICDIKSYLYAMYYMCSFNEPENIIMFWDEPTITLDYQNHEFHSIIQDVWNKNKIPNIILSSATLPKEDEIQNVIIDFQCKFNDSMIYTISSDDCKKTIPILNKYGYVELPHYLYNNYEDIYSCSKHCFEYKTILRYFDLDEISKFILYINDNKLLTSDEYYIDNYFDNIEDVCMYTIKENYLHILQNIKNTNETWQNIYQYFQNQRTLKIIPQKDEDNKKDPTNLTSITTKHAHTLTDGPTIYIAEDIDKIAKFCLIQADIPKSIMQEINETIKFNNKVNHKINETEKKLEDYLNKKNNSNSDETKSGKNKDKNANIKLDTVATQIQKEINSLTSLIKPVSMMNKYIPNTLEHLKRFVDINDFNVKKPYSSNINDDDIERIMSINDIEDIWKILLLLGIGLFSQKKSITYTEMVKEFASKQKLYLILANGDYIYGTNYQFCHEYIAKDLSNITQEKIIQTLGRCGRGHLQQDYTIRFRDDTLINKLFQVEENKIEVCNFNNLFKSEL